MRTAKAPLRLADAAADTNLLAPQVGTALELLPDGGVLVSLGEGLPGIPARCAAGLPGNMTEHLPCPVVLVFENADPGKPIALAMLAPAAPRHATTLIPASDTGKAPRDCVVDGRKVVFDAKEEIVLRCGEGSITLRADGRIILKGREIVSRAFEANKIKGSTVNIN